MEDGFKVRVSGITKSEYMAAVRRLALRKIVPAVILAAVVAFFVLVFGDGSPVILLFPVLVAAFAGIYYEIINLRNFKKFPKDLEMEYELDRHGWRLYVQEGTGLCAWANTISLRENSEVFLLYNSKTTSNLLPKRCLTEEQMKQIRAWYKDRYHLPGFDED